MWHPTRDGISWVWALLCSSIFQLETGSCHHRIPWRYAMKRPEFSMRCLPLSTLENALHIDHNVTISSKAGNPRPFSRQTNFSNNSKNSIKILMSSLWRQRWKKRILKSPQGISNLGWLAWSMNSQNEVTARQELETASMSLHESYGFCLTRNPDASDGHVNHGCGIWKGDHRNKDVFAAAKGALAATTLWPSSMECTHCATLGMNPSRWTAYCCTCGSRSDSRRTSIVNSRTSRWPVPCAAGARSAASIGCPCAAGARSAASIGCPCAAGARSARYIGWPCAAGARSATYIRWPWGGGWPAISNLAEEQYDRRSRV